MRIATWNLESVRNLTTEREAAFQQAMVDVDADVWVLTETWTTFSPGSGFRLVARTQEAADLKQESDRCWVAIWARSSLVATPQAIRSQPDRMASGRIERPGREDIVVLGTVLPWLSDELWPGAAGFCASLASQAAEWRSLRGRDGCTLVIVGDFNQSVPYERWYGSKKGEAALNRALQEFDLLCLTQGNCPLTNKPRIDHICVERSGVNLHSLPRIDGWAIPTINGRLATDHSGVWIDLEKKKGTRPDIGG